MLRSILTVTLSGLLFACGGGGGSSDNQNSVTTPDAGNSGCPDNMICDFFDAPKDYQITNGETVKIHYAVHRATKPESRIGILVFNYGGPGGESVNNTGWMVENALPAELTERFDIIGMDPRGAGQSAFADELSKCAIAMSKNQGTCDSTYANVAPFVGSNSVVNDLEQLRIALGEEKLNFLGYSYGTRLGALYANTFPKNVRAIVLDSPMSPGEDNYFELVKGKISGFDKVVDYRLGFNDTYKTQYINLFQHLMTNNYYTANDGAILTANEAYETLFATSGREASGNWQTISSGVFTLLKHDYAQKLKSQIPHIYYPEQNEDDYRFSALFEAVLCTDEITPLSEAEIIARSGEYNALSTLFAETGKAWSTMCADWPHQQDPIAIVESMENVLTDQQILVIAGKYDTNTHYPWGEAMAASFGELATMITVDNLADHGFSYTGLECVDQYTTQYLLNPTEKQPDSTCGAGMTKRGATSKEMPAGHPVKRANPRSF